LRAFLDGLRHNYVTKKRASSVHVSADIFPLNAQFQDDLSPRSTPVNLNWLSAEVFIKVGMKNIRFRVGGISKTFERRYRHRAMRVGMGD
jgi:hypothetical protein